MRGVRHTRRRTRRGLFQVPAAVPRALHPPGGGAGGRRRRRRAVVSRLPRSRRRRRVRAVRRRRRPRYRALLVKNVRPHLPRPVPAGETLWDGAFSSCFFFGSTNSTSSLVVSSQTMPSPGGSASGRDSGSMICPWHYCHTCVAELHTAHHTHKKLLRCIKCPTAYHSSKPCCHLLSFDSTPPRGGSSTARVWHLVETTKAVSLFIVDGSHAQVVESGFDIRQSVVCGNMLNMENGALL